MSGPEWAPWADRDGRAWTCNTMHANTTARRVGLHWTASRKDSSPKSQADYMWKTAGPSTGYHLIVPIEDNAYRPLQLRPFSCAAGSFYNSGLLDRSPNREGTVSIQISMVCTTGDDPFIRGPGPWWPQVLDLLDSWEIPRRYVWGQWNADAVMPTDIWYSASSGYTAHKQVPEVPGTVRKPDPGPVADDVLWPDHLILEEDHMGLFTVRDGEPGAGSCLLIAGGRRIDVDNINDRIACEQAYGEAEVSRALWDRIRAQVPA